MTGGLVTMRGIKLSAEQHSPEPARWSRFPRGSQIEGDCANVVVAPTVSSRLNRKAISLPLRRRLREWPRLFG